jgi:hypothetical protein
MMCPHHLPMREPERATRLLLFLVLIASCSKAGDAPPPRDTTTAPRVEAGAAPGDPKCPATGMWADCSLLYRLERAGLAPKVDSTTKPEEKLLTGRAMVIKIGTLARLEAFLYSDSVARVADGKKLDRSTLVGGTSPQSMKRERTLIENANLIGLLTSINDRQRERVSDALLAGPPQPSEPVRLPSPGRAIR